MSSFPLAECAAFLTWYRDSHLATERQAAALGTYLTKLLADENIRVHMVSARAKSLDSTRAKLLRKAYRQPRRRLTDRLGARVIVYHAFEVDRVAAIIRSSLEVRERDSSDKRLALGLREFGYRSYHLVGRVPDRLCSTPAITSLRGQVFEIQIRSLLEHIWAEIEHGVAYKSGADLPQAIKRRFASIAGTLELLESEFLSLTKATTGLVSEARAAIAAGGGKALNLDLPHLHAVLEDRWPGGRSFDQALRLGEPFPPTIDNRLLLAMRREGVTTVRSLTNALRSSRIKRLVRRYAAAEAVHPSQLSHLALMAILVASRRKGMIKTFFPEFVADPSLEYALQGA